MHSGIDEAGMGSLIGPLVAAVVVLPDGVGIRGVKDSKKMTVEQREEVASAIMEQALFYKVAHCSATEIDRRGLFACWKDLIRGLAEAAYALYPQEIVLDGNRLVGLSYVIPVVKADATHLAVSAASILAKHTQVCWCIDADKKYPQYNLLTHHGYATPEHLRALQEYGPCEEHRKSFKPVAAYLAGGKRDGTEDSAK